MNTTLTRHIPFIFHLALDKSMTMCDHWPLEKGRLAQSHRKESPSGLAPDLFRHWMADHNEWRGCDESCSGFYTRSGYRHSSEGGSQYARRRLAADDRCIGAGDC